MPETESDVDSVAAAETQLAPVDSTGVAKNGGAAGYKSRKTMPARVELWRQTRRRRTWIMFGLLALVPWLIVGGFELGDDDRAGSGVSDIATTGGLNFAMLILYLSAGFLLVIMVALFFGDTVASESSWANLKYLLASPVPRGRLLRQKAVVATFLSLCGIALLTAMSLVAGTIWYGTGELLTLTGDTMSFPIGLLCVAGAMFYVTVHLSWIAGLALWLSVSTDTPLGAVGGAMVVSIVSQILDRISALGDLRQYLPTHYAMAWSDLLSADLNWADISYGLFSGLAYAAGFVLLASWRFSRRDIKT